MQRFWDLEKQNPFTGGRVSWLDQLPVGAAIAGIFVAVYGELPLVALFSSPGLLYPALLRALRGRSAATVAQKARRIQLPADDSAAAEQALVRVRGVVVGEAQVWSRIELVGRILYGKYRPRHYCDQRRWSGCAARRPQRVTSWRGWIRSSTASSFLYLGRPSR